MTSLSIFQPEIVTIETQLTALQTQLEELRQAEDIATQLLSTLADTLPRFEKLGAIARIKTAVLGLFGDEAPKFENFMTEVPATNPTTEEIFDEEALPHTPEQAESRVEETAEQVNYIELVQVNPTLAYQRKHDGEIVCAYLGCVNQKLAKDWAETLELWGCGTEVRKAKRLTGADIKWEVKIRKISSDRIDTLALAHTSPFQSVPAPQATRQQVKKSETAPSPSALNGGAPSDEKNDASNAAPQVSLVLGKADNIYISYFVMVGSSTIGRVERLSATSKWSVPGMPGIWETKEEAADALIAKREADRKLHQDTNDLLRAKYGLPV
jgi:hypothetical protein